MCNSLAHLSSVPGCGVGATAMMPEVLNAATVAEKLRSASTRASTLSALEALPPPIPSDVALAVAPALTDVACSTEHRDEHDRAALLRARLLAEAPDPVPVFRLLAEGKRFAAIWAPRVLAEATAAAEGGQPLTWQDARSYACSQSYCGPAFVRGHTAPCLASGRSAPEYYNAMVSELPARLTCDQCAVGSSSH